MSRRRVGQNPSISAQSKRDRPERALLSATPPRLSTRLSLPVLTPGVHSLIVRSPSKRRRKRPSHADQLGAIFRRITIHRRRLGETGGMASGFAEPGFSSPPRCLDHAIERIKFCQSVRVDALIVGLPIRLIIHSIRRSRIRMVCEGMGRRVSHGEEDRAMAVGRMGWPSTSMNSNP